MKKLLASAAFGLAVPASGQVAAPGDGITLSSNAWSTAPTRWTVHRDGSVDDARGAGGPAITLPVEMVTHYLPPMRGRYATIEHLLAPVRGVVGRKIECVSEHSDDYRGRVVWSDGVWLTYSFGCDGPANQPIIDSVRAASAQVSAWTANAPVVRRYRITTPKEFNKQ